MLVVSMMKFVMNLQDVLNQFIYQFPEYRCRTLPTCSFASLLFFNIFDLKMRKNEFRGLNYGLRH